MIISAQSPFHNKPFIEIIDQRPDQVILRFIDRDEHVTLHLQQDGSIIKTHYCPNKPRSTWDKTNIEIARSLNYRQPERHGSYVNNRPLPKIDNVDGYYLLGRRIDLQAIQPRQRYYNHIQQTLTVPNNQFMLECYLSTQDNNRNFSGLFVNCNLGEICLELGQTDVSSINY